MFFWLRNWLDINFMGKFTIDVTGSNLEKLMYFSNNSIDFLWILCYQSKRWVSRKSSQCGPFKMVTCWNTCGNVMSQTFPSIHYTMFIVPQLFLSENKQKLYKNTVWSKIWWKKYQRIFSQKLWKHSPNNYCWRFDSIEFWSVIFSSFGFRNHRARVHDIQLETYFECIWFSSFNCAKRTKFIACGKQ